MKIDSFLIAKATRCGVVFNLSLMLNSHAGHSPTCGIDRRRELWNCTLVIVPQVTKKKKKVTNLALNFKTFNHKSCPRRQFTVESKLLLPSPDSIIQGSFSHHLDFSLPTTCRDFPLLCCILWCQKQLTRSSVEAVSNKTRTVSCDTE